jgi:hypothetical protein
VSTWRKAVAVGAFSAGTFGLGFTLGGHRLRPLAPRQGVAAAVPAGLRD